MKTRTIELKHEVSEIFLQDIIDSGLCAGTTEYWAEIRRLRPEGETGLKGKLHIREEEAPEGGEWKELNHDLVAKGVALLASGEVKVNPQIRKWICEGIAQDDAGNIDAECWDCIMQAAVLGSIVYG